MIATKAVKKYEVAVISHEPVVSERPTVKVSLLWKQILSSPATSLPSEVSGKNATRPVPEYGTPGN